MSKKKILVVEDEEMTARLIVYRLKALGFEVEHAVDGLKGLELIKKNRPDLAVLDVMLPGISGFEILQNLQDDPDFDSSNIRIIMLTSKNRAEDVSRGFKCVLHNCKS